MNNPALNSTRIPPQPRPLKMKLARYRFPSAAGFAWDDSPRAQAGYVVKECGDHVLIRLGPIFNHADLSEIALRLDALDATPGTHPHRLIDLSGAATIALNYEHMLDFAERRQAAKLDHEVRLAGVVNTPEKYGMMRIFQAVNNHPMIKIGIFSDITTALGWIRGNSAHFCNGFPVGNPTKMPA